MRTRSNALFLVRLVTVSARAMCRASMPGPRFIALARLATFVLAFACAFGASFARADSAPTVTVTTPIAGASLTQMTVHSLQFSAKNWDTQKSYRFMPILLRNGAPLGAVNAVGYQLNTTSTSVGVAIGQYVSGYSTPLATPGSGYSYRVTVYEGTWGQHKVIASGTGPKFTIVAPPAPSGPPSVTVTTPTAGQTLKIGATYTVQFAAKNWDTTKSLRYMPVLVRNGTEVGSFNAVGYGLSSTSTSVGVSAGTYVSGYSLQSAPAGNGYAYRITIYEGSWGQHTVVASGTSPTFTLVK